eukprot:GFUD01039046.1.p1 GENE.GFUD01039046.1~~GFUD01039046.1.p1  ORF type:complete len:171 (+),score=27.27 GFUD01039046.1:46-558(+)
MTIYTRSSLQTNTLPRGWKLIKARPVNTMVENIFYISPEGKRFQSLEAAKAWLLCSIESFTDSEIIDSPKKVSRRIHEEKAEAEIEYALNKYRVELPENIKRRRKMMASKSPFRNLLKVTLTRNYKMKKRQEDKMRRKPLLGWWRDPRKRKFLSQRITQIRTGLSTRREG